MSGKKIACMCLVAGMMLSGLLVAVPASGVEKTGVKAAHWPYAELCDNLTGTTFNAIGNYANATGYRIGISDQFGKQSPITPTIPPRFDTDIGTTQWATTPAAVGQEMVTVFEVVRGLNGWTGANYTAFSHRLDSLNAFAQGSGTTITAADMTASTTPMDTAFLELIPTPVLNHKGSSYVNITWTGLKDQAANVGSYTTNLYAGNGVKNYTVYRSTDNISFSDLGISTAQVSLGSVYYNDATVVAGTTYYYKIAVNFRADGVNIGNLYTTAGRSYGSAGIPVVAPLTIDDVRIRNASGGGGSIITTKSYTIGGSDTFYAAGYNNTTGDFMQDIICTWASDNPGVGTVSTPGTSTTFNAVGAGVCNVTATNVTTPSITNKTGTLTVTAGAVATATGPTGYTNSTSINLTYTWVGTPTSVKIYNSTDGNATWTLAVNDATVNGWEVWTVPAGVRTYGWIAVAIGGLSPETDPPAGGTAAEAYPLILDTVAPTVTGVDPAPGATGVPTTTKINKTFIESMNKTSVEANFKVYKDGSVTPIGGSYSWELGDTKCVFTPSPALDGAAKYWSNVSIAAKDLAGNLLAAANNTYFTTPLVATATGPTGYSTSTSVTITYSCPAGPTSVDIYRSKDFNATWTLQCTDTSIDGTNATTITAGDGTYWWHAVAIGGGSVDTAPTPGTAAEAGPWILDTAAPTITAVYPAAGATGVSVGTTAISKTFNESMNKTSVETNFKVYKDGVAAPLTVSSYTWDINKCTLNLGVSLEPNTKYWSNLSTGAKDLAGNSLSPAENKTWFETGGAAADEVWIMSAPGGTGSNITGPFLIGQAVTFYAVCYNKTTGIYDPVSAIWSSSNPSVGTITTPGASATFTAVGKGTTTITCTAETVPKSITITVTEAGAAPTWGMILTWAGIVIAVVVVAALATWYLIKKKKTEVK